MYPQPLGRHKEPLKKVTRLKQDQPKTLGKSFMKEWIIILARLSNKVPRKA